MKVLIKYGGAAMEDRAVCRRVAREIAQLAAQGKQIVVVHGGGKEVTRFLRKLGKESRFVSGLRYTDSETLEIVEMMFSGLINKRFVSDLGLAGAKAVGLSGRDAKLFEAAIISEEKFGFVGEIKKVNCTLLNTLLGVGYIPVISSISEDRGGNPLNVNADLVASAVAGALQVDELIYLSDIDGLMRGGTLVNRLTLAEAEALLNSPEVTEGMIPKLQSALDSLRSGIKKVRFLNGAEEQLLSAVLLHGKSAGTELLAK